MPTKRMPTALEVFLRMTENQFTQRLIDGAASLVVSPVRHHLTDRDMLRALGLLGTTMKVMIPRQRARSFETGPVEALMASLKRVMQGTASPGDLNHVAMVRRLMGLLGPGYLETLVGVFGIERTGLGTLGDRIRVLTGTPWFHVLAVQVNSECNMRRRCRGCYAALSKDGLDYPTLDSLMAQSMALGARFTVVLGGEPLLMKEELLSLFGNYPRMPFLVASNGIAVDEAFAREVARLGNVFMLLNVHGLETTTTKITGCPEVWAQVKAAAKTLTRHGVPTAFLATVFPDTYLELSGPEFVEQMLDWDMLMGLCFGYTTPIGSRPRSEWELTPGMIDEFGGRIGQLFNTHPLLMIDTIRAENQAAVGGCPAARGQLIHVQSDGCVGGCPIVPVNNPALNIHDYPLVEILRHPFHRCLRTNCGARRGCQRHPGLLAELEKCVGSAGKSGGR